MERRVQDTFHKITMDETKKEEIRTAIGESRKRNYTWLKCVAGAAACMAILLGVPATRQAIVHAADYVRQIFHTADGGGVEYESTGNELRFSIATGDREYVRIENDRIYLTVGEEKIDVTEACGEDSYYRYEQVNADGSRSVIFVGGTAEDVGWVELLFDADGNYVFNQMKVPTDEAGMAAGWVNKAMHAEGVPCGDGLLDQELEK